MLEHQENLVESTIREAKEMALKKGKAFMLLTSLKDLMEREFPPNKWLVENLIPSAGITVISAPPSSYKTWVMLSLAISVSKGEPLFDNFETEQAKVLIIDEESGPARLQDRFRKLHADLDLPIFIWSLQGFKLEKKWIDELIKKCEEAEIGLVIFDSFVRLHNQDENDASHMARLLQLLKDCTTRGITIVFAHHNRKPGASRASSDLPNSMRGSSDILAAVDCHLALIRNEHRLIVAQTKSRDAEELPHFELEVRTDDDEVTIEYTGAVTRPPKKADKARTPIKEILAQEPSLNQKQLRIRLEQAGFEIGSRTLSKTLSQMVEEGVISKDGGIRNEVLYGLNEELTDD